MVWFKNLQLYRLTKDINLVPDSIEVKLQEFKFSPCGSQDQVKFGWITALGKYGDMLTHEIGDHILICLRKEEKMLPSSVIKASLEKKVEEIEIQQGRSLKKKEKDSLKDDIITTLLPRAFSRVNDTYALIMPRHNLVLVDASSSKKAEVLLGLLRKSLGSLPVVPVETQEPLALTMTKWVRSQITPKGFTVLFEAELTSEQQEGGVIRCKHQDLRSDEILSHIEANKFVTKLALNWQDRIEFVLEDDFSIKRLRFADTLKDENADINKEDVAQRMDADLSIMCGEFDLFLNDLFAELTLKSSDTL